MKLHHSETQCHMIIKFLPQKPRKLSHYMSSAKVIKRANIRIRYNQVPHLTQDTNGKVTNSQLDITNESPFPAGAHEATINRRAPKHSKHTTEIT